MAARLLKRLTPSQAAHQKYRAHIETYLDLVRPLLRYEQKAVITGFRLRRSKLFDDRQYLTAYVEDDWLSAVAPTCDAICSAMAPHQGGPDEWVQLPPLVFIPDSKRRARSNAFRSVVEHEFVHVNQAILGTFPELPLGRRAEDLLDFFVGLFTAEHEASFLQISRWTDTFPTQAGVSLEHWCLVRGYSQALEQVLLALADQDFSARAALGFIDTLQSTLPDLLRDIGASEDLIPWFTSRLDLHLFIATQNVVAHLPTAKDASGLRAVARWIETSMNEADPGLDGER